MEIRQYTRVLTKWWWLILASVLVAGIASLLGSLATPRTYQARTTLMVGQALQNPNPNQADLFTGQSLAQSYSDLARRQPVLEGALTALGLKWDWTVLQNMVSSRVVPSTQLLEITVLDSDPQRAKVLVDEIANQLILQSPSASDPEKETERQFILSQINDLKSNITKATAEIRQLDDTIARANSARQIQDARNQQTTLQTQVSAWQATYAQLLTSLQQGTINVLSVVEPARMPTQPIGARPSENMLLAAGIGLMLSVGAAFLLDYLDDTLRTPDDVGHVLQLPVLGRIAKMNGEGYTSKLITSIEPRAPAAEAYRVLRTNLQFGKGDHPVRTLVVSSASPMEGKSVTAANLAVTIAQTGRRAILIDADLRRPVQHHLFDLNNDVGLSTVLTNGIVQLADVLQATCVEHLKVMTAGPVPVNPAELLGSIQMTDLLTVLKEHSEIVIFDSTPVMAAADATVLAPQVDGVLMVIDSGRTRRGLAKRSQEVLTSVGAQVLGVVLNRVPERSDDYNYYYYAEDIRPQHRFAMRNLLARFVRSNGHTSKSAEAVVTPSKDRARASQPDGTHDGR